MILNISRICSWIVWCYISIIFKNFFAFDRWGC